MGILVMVMGESGSGKSCSLRNFSPEEVGVFNVASKPLPFRKQIPTVNGATYDTIIKSLQKNTRKAYVIDDSQYLLAFDFFARAKETGYGKFTDLALSFKQLLDYVVNNTSPDTIVYFMHHVESTDNGKVKAKTIGKLLDEKLTIEGLFSIVLLAKTDGQRYWFETQSDGFTTAKSPMEMFEREIDNDLKLVDTKIREYYNLTKGE